MSPIVRHTVSRSFGSGRKKLPKIRKQFPLVGAGRSNQGRLAPVSERHDEALAQIPLGKKRRKHP